MSSSRSVLSNESSHSNLLTLSRDSSSSQLKSKSANIYYKKFISKLGFLFRIDTQDLDALYNKIVECVHESDGFTSSDDADIAELIQLARKLQDNHNLLKNMVEVLDQRFLKKINTPTKKSDSAQKNNFSFSLTPSQKFDSNKTNNQVAAFANNYNNQIQTNGQITNQSNAQHDYGKYFTDTLQKARQAVQKKKDLIRMEQQKQEQHQKQKQIQMQPQTENSTFNSFIKRQNNYDSSNKPQIDTFYTQQSPSLKKSVYQGRVSKIFEQMNKIKAELHKIESNQNYNEQNQLSDPQVSLTFDTPFFQTHKTTQSQLVQKNKFEQDKNHQVFKQIQQDTYYLYDDRFSKSQQINSSNMPKLSLKNLYTKMGINPNQPENAAEVPQIQMAMIRQSSKQSQSMTDYRINKQQQQQNELNLVQHSAHRQNHYIDEQLIKTKSANVSTEAGNLTLQFSGHPIQRQKQMLHNKYYQQEHENEQNSPQSQKSHSVSNATIIDKLSNIPNINTKNVVQKNNDKQYTNTSIFYQEYVHNQQQYSKKKQTLGSIATTNNNSGKSGYFGSMVIQDKNKVDLVSPLQYQKSKFYMEIVQRNDKSRQKINEYLSKLDERNRVLKQYVDDIQKSLSKQKQRRVEVGLTHTKSRQLVTQSNVQSLTNTIYTDNQVIVPKYIPTYKQQFKNQELSYPLPLIQPLSKNIGNQQNFSFSQVNPIVKTNAQFSPKFNTYSQKQFDTPRRQMQDSIEQRGMKPLVPMLINLVQNQQKNIENKNFKKEISQHKSNTQLQNKQSKAVLKNNHYLTHQCSLFDQQHYHQHENKGKNISSHKHPKQKIQIIKNNDISSFHKKQQNHSLQLISNQSLNSIQGRIQENHKLNDESMHPTEFNSNPIVIPRVSANSLFEQTRNVQSKIELSEDRGYKIRVPGEEIEKIKDRVNEMFKKIKSIRQDSNNPLTKLDIHSSKSFQQIEDHKTEANHNSSNLNQINKPQRIQNENKIWENKPKLQFKVPQKQFPNQVAQFRQTGTFFNPQQQKIPIQNVVRNTAPISSSSYVTDSLVIDNNNKGIATRFSFMFQSVNRSSRQSTQNRISLPVPTNYEYQQKNITSASPMNYSRQSNFSFKGFASNAFGQDSIRSQVRNSTTHFPIPPQQVHQIQLFQHVQNAQQQSRTSSNASSREKRVEHISILPRDSITSKVVSIHRPPSVNSVKSSSNQSKSSIVRPAPTNNFVPFKNNPPLPPRPQPLRQSLIKTSVPSVPLPINMLSISPKYENKMAIQSPSIKNNIGQKTTQPTSYAKQLKQQMARTPKAQNPINIIPVHNRGLSRNYSQAILTQSVVTSYPNPNSNQKQFVPPHLASVPIYVTPRSRRDQNNFQQNFSPTSFNTSIVLPQNSHVVERSSQRSNKSKSKKGIRVISKDQAQV